MGAPILSCVKKGVPEIFMDCHMMVADPIKVRFPSSLDSRDGRFPQPALGRPTYPLVDGQRPSPRECQ